MVEIMLKDMDEQKVIEACYQGDIFLCPICNKKKRYNCSGLCKTCYSNERYQLSERERRSRKLQYKKQFDSG